jgi:hypothetical protein
MSGDILWLQEKSRAGANKTSTIFPADFHLNWASFETADKDMLVYLSAG